MKEMLEALGCSEAAVECLRGAGRLRMREALGDCRDSADGQHPSASGGSRAGRAWPAWATQRDVPRHSPALVEWGRSIRMAGVHALPLATAVVAPSTRWEMVVRMEPCSNEGAWASTAAHCWAGARVVRNTCLPAQSGRPLLLYPRPYSTTIPRYFPPALVRTGNTMASDGVAASMER